MFTTFHSSLPPRSASDHQQQDGNSKPPTVNRPKRHQVRRACDWCKLMRVKCDNHRPCSNCQQASRDCATSGENQFRSIAEAVKEVKRLRAQVRDMESPQNRRQAPDGDSQAHGQSPQPVDPPVASPTNPPEPRAMTRREKAASTSSHKTRSVSGQPHSGQHDATQGIAIRHGITSLPSLLERMGRHLQSTRQQPQLHADLSTCAGSCSQQDINAAGGHGFLSRQQEVHFLDLFWQTHYFSYPILNEAQVRNEYKALWADQDPTVPRRPSPLIDVILALCIQLGSSYMDSGLGGGDKCASLAGFQYYRRCEEYIDQAIEGPSITTVQCYIFSIVYLYEAGLLNRAQVVAGQAIMMAMILGLCNEPLSTEPEPQKEVTRRTWWSLYILDAKLNMEVGRQPLLGPSNSTCNLPSDSNEVAQWLGPHYSFDDSCPTWLGFQTQTLRLLNAVREVRTSFYARYGKIVGENGYKEFADNTTAREECAGILTDQMKALDSWARQLPDGYIVPRRDGQPYSTDRSPVDIRADTIIHCQRQRLLLELQYHLYCMSFYQPFITFNSAFDVSTPLSDTMATAALNHAITLTDIINQSHAFSMVLGGVHHVMRWQVTALFVMMGFVYTYPLNSSIPAARRAIELAVSAIDAYGNAVPHARGVATIARGLGDDIDAFIKNLHPDSGSSRGSRSSSSPSSLTFSGASSATTAMEGSINGQTPATMNAPDPPLGPLPLVNAFEKAMSPSSNIMSMDFLGHFGEDGTQIESMDMMWSNLDPGDIDNAALWTLVPPGDNRIDGSI